MLKMTGVKLEKISNIDKYLFIEKVLRGGIFLTLLKGMQKRITNTQKTMILKNPQHLQLTWIRIIYMVG